MLDLSFIGETYRMGMFFGIRCRRTLSNRSSSCSERKIVRQIGLGGDSCLNRARMAPRLLRKSPRYGANWFDGRPRRNDRRPTTGTGASLGYSERKRETAEDVDETPSFRPSTLQFRPRRNGTFRTRAAIYV